ncbi:hypothetical protein JCM1841_005253 [Sporobolomyces salmonicolor]
MSTASAPNAPDAPVATSMVSDKPPAWVCNVAESPITAWSTSALMLAAVPLCVKNPLGFPHLVQLPLFAAIFGGSGYMVHVGDPVNGSGTTTAWSLTYLFLNGRKALVSRRPGPIALAAAAAAQAGTYGWYYSKT